MGTNHLSSARRTDEAACPACSPLQWKHPGMCQRKEPATVSHSLTGVFFCEAYTRGVTRLVLGKWLSPFPTDGTTPASKEQTM